MHPVFFGSAITGAGVDALIGRHHRVAAGGRRRCRRPGLGHRVQGRTRARPARRSRTSACSRARVRTAGPACSFGRDETAKVTAISVFDGGAAVRAASVAAGQIGKLWGLATSRSATRSASRGAAAGAPPLRAADAGDGRRARPPGRQGRAARRARPARRAGSADQPAAGRRPPGDCSSRSTARCRRRSSRRRWPTTSASTSSSARRRRSASSGPSAPARPSRSSRQAPNPFLATVGLRVEPAPIGSGVRFRPGIELGAMPLSFFKAVEETVHADAAARALRLAGHRLHGHA